MPENADVRPFSCKRNYERVVDYFLSADDALLSGMGVERSNLPTRETWVDRIASDLERNDREKQTFYVSWIYDGEAVGHSNINALRFGDEATMHLHIWKPDLRHRGL